MMAISTSKTGQLGRKILFMHHAIRQFNNLWASLAISRRILQLLPEPKLSGVYLLIPCNVVN